VPRLNGTSVPDPPFEITTDALLVAFPLRPASSKVSCDNTIFGTARSVAFTRTICDALSIPACDELTGSEQLYVPAASDAVLSASWTVAGVDDPESVVESHGAEMPSHVGVPTLRPPITSDELVIENGETVSAVPTSPVNDSVD
jgi:hypothetical protein